MSTLTDRYVWAAVRSIPEKQRGELEPELRGLIADTADAQREKGVADPDIERATLLELGDPERLAAGYTERTLQLIGPRYYLDWLRLLKLLLAIVVPIAALGAALGRLIAGGDVGDVIAALFVTAIGVGVHLCFWVTLVFALVERDYSQRSKTGRDSPLLAWTPDTLPQLPAPAARRQSLAELIVSLVFLAVFAGWFFWQQFNSFLTDADGTPIPVLEPALWNGWMYWFLGLIALEMVFAVMVYQRGRMTLGLASIKLLLNVAFTVPAVWLLLTEQLINPAFLDAIPGTGADFEVAMTYTVPVIAFIVIGVAVWDVVDGFIKAWRSRHVTDAA
ncbi:hypothetical protein ASC66_07760 [Leifsonia sp. Root4]|uniref:hypothetical protein n=1 Tax=Leifsonia sp. Root4 TaxID=1736525 RepID=UPI0006FCF42F|nr:hypothetical protein [Leifsonia sp. Root4]KQW06389.1 hypothetical protein ASC66_07760 [Leifsonia sp. Root4]